MLGLVRGGRAGNLTLLMMKAFS